MWMRLISVLTNAKQHYSCPVLACRFPLCSHICEHDLPCRLSCSAPSHAPAALSCPAASVYIPLSDVIRHRLCRPASVSRLVLAVVPASIFPSDLSSSISFGLYPNIGSLSRLRQSFSARQCPGEYSSVGCHPASALPSRLALLSFFVYFVRIVSEHRLRRAPPSGIFKCVTSFFCRNICKSRLFFVPLHRLSVRIDN